MGVTEPQPKPALNPADDHAIVLEGIDFMMKIETLSDEQRRRLQDIKALVDRRRR